MTVFDRIVSAWRALWRDGRAPQRLYWDERRGALVVRVRGQWQPVAQSVGTVAQAERAPSKGAKQPLASGLGQGGVQDEHPWGRDNDVETLD